MSKNEIKPSIKIAILFVATAAINTSIVSGLCAAYGYLRPGTNAEKSAQILEMFTLLHKAEHEVIAPKNENGKCFTIGFETGNSDNLYTQWVTTGPTIVGEIPTHILKNDTNNHCDARSFPQAEAMVKADFNNLLGETGANIPNTYWGGRKGYAGIKRITVPETSHFPNPEVTPSP
jgi:hypothetical protein